jgi:hypothetical protein
MHCGELPSNSGVLGSDQARPSGACLACRYCAPRERGEGQAPVAPPPPLPRPPPGHQPRGPPPARPPAPARHRPARPFHPRAAKAMPAHKKSEGRIGSGLSVCVCLSGEPPIPLRLASLWSTP